MPRYLKLLALSLLLLQSAVMAQIPGLPVVDFERYFPHLTAVSDEQTNGEYPDGVQYKFLTVRDEVEKVVILALTRREGKDKLARVFLAKGPIEGSESTLRKTVLGFAERTGLKFEFVDLQDVRTFEQFERRSKELGWGLEVRPK